MMFTSFDFDCLLCPWPLTSRI